MQLCKFGFMPGYDVWTHHGETIHQRTTSVVEDEDERLHTPDDSGYHENQVSDGELDEVYQDDELSYSFNINPDLVLNSLVGDVNDVTLPEQRKQTLRNTKKRNILDILYILYYVTYILYYVICISYYVFDEYSLVPVLNRMSKRLKSVTEKLSGGKSSSGALSTDTLF
jgi:hypothetical protein